MNIEMIIKFGGNKQLQNYSSTGLIKKNKKKQVIYVALQIRERLLF